MAGGVEKIEAVIHPDNTLRSSSLPLHLERRMKRGLIELGIGTEVALLAGWGLVGASEEKLQRLERLRQSRDGRI